MDKKKQTLDFLERIINELEAVAPTSATSVGVRLQNCRGVTIRRCYIEAGIPIDAAQTSDLNLIDNELVSTASIPEAIELLKVLRAEVKRTSPSQAEIERSVQKLKRIVPKAIFGIIVQTLIWLGHEYLRRYLGLS
jgi:hypothetical protein